MKTIAKTEPEIIAGSECTQPVLIPTEGYLVLKPQLDGAQTCIAVANKYKDSAGNVKIKL
jgi:hypothetical protein